jgi:hypothetical protein
VNATFVYPRRGFDASTDLCYPYESQPAETKRLPQQPTAEQTFREKAAVNDSVFAHMPHPPRSAPVQPFSSSVPSASQTQTQPPAQPQPPVSAKTPQQPVALIPVLLAETDESRTYIVLNHRFTVDKRFKLVKGLGVGAYGVVW